MSRELTCIAHPEPPISELYHGVRVEDPYRWLEDQNSPATRDFIATKSQEARQYLNSISGREIIRQRISEMLRTEEIRGIRKVGNRYFFMKFSPEREQPLIAMREENSKQDVVLIDPAARHEGTSVSVHLVSVSPNGRLLAYGVKRGGEDAQSLELLDIESRTILPDDLPTGLLRGFAFAPDSKSFYYILEPVGSDKPTLHASYQHHIGESLANDRFLYSAGEDPRTRFTIAVSKDGKYAVYYVRHMVGSEKLRNHYLQDLRTLRVTRLVHPEDVVRFRAGFLENRLVGTLRYADGKVSMFELDRSTPNETQWKLLYTDNSQNLGGVLIRENRIFRSSIRNFCTHTEILNDSGKHIGEIPYSCPGTANLAASEEGSKEIFVHFDSFTIPPTIFRFIPATGQLTEWTRKSVPFNPEMFSQSEVWYTSTDGTPIHMFLVSHKDLPSDQPAPTLLTSYGGFGTNMTPKFSVFVTFMLEQGCRFALPNIRGGSELGRPWHEAGKRHNRQHVFDDFLAAAEWLLANGYTIREQLAIFGGSNSGLLVGAAMTQRPDLFRAVLCIAPVLDMLRYDQFDRAYQWVDEYGIASDPADFAVLHAYSPYHRVQDGTAYPATLFVSGDADQRCNPMHVRKMVARLQAANSATTPILMDYSTTRGHSPNMPLSTRIDALTDRLAFICHQLGIEVKPIKNKSIESQGIQTDGGSLCVA